MAVQITKSKLVAELQRLAAALGETPSMREMRAEGAFSPSTYQSRFGSWNEAVEAAGLTPNDAADRVLTDDDLLADVREVARALDRPPSRAEFRERGTHAPSTYADRFGSWSNALEAAGLTPNERTTAVRDRELLAELRRLTDEFGRPPTQELVEEHGEHSVATYYRHFESWPSAMAAAGVADRAEHALGKDVSAEALTEEITRMTSVLGRPPTMAEMDELGEFSASTCARRFGSWNEALVAAGFEPPCEEALASKNRVTDAELVAELHRLAEAVGRSPTVEEMWKDGEYGSATYLERFGSWNLALDAAGLDARRYRGERIPERRLLVVLRGLGGTLGRVPRRKDMDECGQFSGTTYYNRFGSWDDALGVAGFDAETSTIRARCDACARETVRDVGAVDADGTVFCGPACRRLWVSPVDFSAVRRLTSLERLGRLLSDAEADRPSDCEVDADRHSDTGCDAGPVSEPAAELLVLLGHVSAFVGSDFDSAVRDGRYRLIRDGDEIHVESLETEIVLTIAEDTARRILPAEA